ncbi:MAG: phosphatase PAP2 family protein [Actinomycetota bacterium]
MTASLLAVLFIALTLVVSIAGSMPGDERVLTELHDAFGTGLDDAMVAVGTVSNTAPLLVVSAVTVAVLFVKGRPRDAAAVLVIVVVAVVGNRILKELIGRSRPDVRASPESVSRYSYPSGHAANTLAVHLALVRAVVHPRSRVLVGIGACFVALVGFSRLVTGVHYPSDILAGWLWVGAWVATAWSWGRGPAA